MPSDLSFSPEEMEVLRQIFLGSSQEYVTTIRGALAAFEQGSGAGERLPELHRAIHSIKGAAFQIGFAPIGMLAKAMESVVIALQGDAGALEPAWVSVLQRGLAAIEASLEALRENRELPAPDQALLSALAACSGEAGSSSAQGERAAGA
jgi:chemosensory pili system protein ChpA (sensor histidine kinase/response regulator)